MGQPQKQRHWWLPRVFVCGHENTGVAVTERTVFKMQDYGQQDDDDDEDLSRNPLVLHLQSNYPLLYEEALREGWTLCVPSVNTLCQHCFDEDYIQQHLIRNNQDSSFTLSNKPVFFTVTLQGISIKGESVGFYTTRVTDQIFC